MKVRLFTAAGRFVAEQQVRDVYDAYAIWQTYQTEYMLLVASNGAPCELFRKERR